MHDLPTEVRERKRHYVPEHLQDHSNDVDNPM